MTCASWVDAMLYIAQTGCQWRHLPESFGPRTRVWSQFRRWSRNGTCQQAFCALNASPGARAYYDELRARNIGHHAALRQLSNRLVGILHGCLKTGTPYDEATAWAHREHDAAA